MYARKSLPPKPLSKPKPKNKALPQYIPTKKQLPSNPSSFPTIIHPIKHQQNTQPSSYINQCKLKIEQLKENTSKADIYYNQKAKDINSKIQTLINALQTTQQQINKQYEYEHKDYQLQIKDRIQCLENSIQKHSKSTIVDNNLLNIEKYTAQLNTKKVLNIEPLQALIKELTNTNNKSLYTIENNSMRRTHIDKKTFAFNKNKLAIAQNMHHVQNKPSNILATATPMKAPKIIKHPINSNSTEDIGTLRDVHSKRNTSVILPSKITTVLSIKSSAKEIQKIWDISDSDSEEADEVAARWAKGSTNIVSTPDGDSDEYYTNDSIQMFIPPPPSSSPVTAVVPSSSSVSTKVPKNTINQRSSSHEPKKKTKKVKKYRSAFEEEEDDEPDAAADFKDGFKKYVPPPPRNRTSVGENSTIWIIEELNRVIEFDSKFFQLTKGKLKKGKASAIVLKPYLESTGLEKKQLRAIWNLSDFDKDGKMTSQEFAMCMFLVEQLKKGIALPVKMPPNYIPPMFREIGKCSKKALPMNSKINTRGMTKSMVKPNIMKKSASAIKGKQGVPPSAMLKRQTFSAVPPPRKRLSGNTNV